MSSSPKLLASVVAVPVAVVTGVLMFQTMRPAAAPAPAPQATDPVAVASVDLTERSATVCRALVARLPERIRAAERRRVTSGSEQNAAYGDPPFVISCGTDKPSIAATDFLPTITGVCWHSVTSGGETVWTTVDREVPVRVRMPDGYEEQGQWVAALSPVIASAVPSTKDKIPSGCGG